MLRRYLTWPLLCLVLMSVAGAGALPHRLLDEGPEIDSFPPVVVKTDPMAGTTDVDPDEIKEIRVSFSKDMADGSWSFDQISPQTFPKVRGKPHFMEDKRTCVLPVSLKPGTTYVIWLNKPPFDSFKDTGGRKALPYLLTFRTQAAEQ